MSTPLIRDAAALWRTGRVTEAELACTAIVAEPGDHADAHALLAEIHGSKGDFRRAAAELRTVAKLRPGDAAVRRRLGDALFAAGNVEASVASFRRAIALEPTHPRAHGNLGRALAALGRRDAAVESYRAAIALDPRHAIAHNNLGILFSQLERPTEALACYERALEVNPQFSEAHANRANALQGLNRIAEAVDGYERALLIDSRNPVVYCNYSNVLLKLRRAGDALAQAERALQLRPNLPEALVSRGNALLELRHLDDALRSYDRAVELQPGNLEALANRANILVEMNRYSEALDCANSILQLRPDFPSALLYRAMSLHFLGKLRYDEAVDAFQSLWKADPTQPYGLGYLLHVSAMISDWSRSDLEAYALLSVSQDLALVSPLALLSISDSAEAQLRCARACVAQSHPVASPPALADARYQHGKIRVAYLSGDLREHALSYLMAGVFEKHDRERFEIYGVSFQPPTNTPFGARVLSSFDAFIDIREHSDEHAARLLREMEIDIAVDLMGFTRGQRLNIFAHRAAPVQVNYLGYPGTSAAPYMDYILADDFVIPERSRRHYSESVVYLPDCFQANDDQRIIAESRPTRVSAGLPDGAFVFCSFNSGYKVTPRMFDIWCRLLRAGPESVLWMIAESEGSRANLRREASKRGIEPQRVIFAERLSYPEHLARMSLADLFLDTLPFNAGTTASDALWSGLPVLTCPGDAYAARMAGSLLRAVGLPELIACDLAEYERLASALSRDPARMTDLRRRLVSNRRTHALFDTERFCRNLECAYSTMHERFQRGEAPADIRVVRSSRR